MDSWYQNKEQQYNAPTLTTQAAVVALIGPVNWDSRNFPDLSPFIDTATLIVNRVCIDPSYDSIILEMIQRYLAAHFYKIADPNAMDEKAGDVAETYQSKIDLGFDLTHFGAQAMRLDIAGGLARLNHAAKTGKLRARIEIFGLGTDAGRRRRDDCFPVGPWD